MADRLDDLICIHDPTGSAMETLAILLLGWIIFGTILTVVGKLLYSRLLDAGPKNSSGISISASTTSSLNSTAPPVSTASSSPQPSAAAPSATAESKPVTNTERFINTLKQHPPPSLPTKLVRSKSTSSRSVDQLHHPDVPSVSGSNADCVKWITNSLSYVYNRNNVLNDLTSSWKDSLNILTKRSEIETGVSVEIQQIVFQDDQNPRINNVFCEITPNERASVTGDFESRFFILVRVSREQRDHQSISDYKLQVERLRGRLNVSADLRESSTAQLKFDGWPDIRLAVVKQEAPNAAAPVPSTGSTTNDEQLLMDIIVEMVTSALRTATTQLHMGRYADFPRFVPSINPAEPILPVHYDSMLETRLRRSAKDKKLLVKVVKANNVGNQKGCHQLHAIIEMDDPPQRHQTTVKQATENPFWDENFLFDLGPNTEEILFEIYDRDKGRNVFLGLGIVGMEELLMNPSQRQIIPLQSRPYENDPVSGTLTVEFLFIDNLDVPSNLPADVVAANKTGHALDSGGMVRRDSYHRATKRPSDLILANEESNKLGTGLMAQNSHVRRLSPRRGPQQRDGDTDEFYKDPYYPESPQMTPGMGSLASSLSSKEEADQARASRPRNKRNFFRTLKDRLSRSKNRSQSVEPGTAGSRDDSLNRDGDPLMRSVSADRGRLGQQHLSVPGAGGTTGNLADSARSSLSEVSVVSNASTRTYLDEASSLVLECTENGIKKHYLIPMAMAEKRKWKKKGTKLHIFSDHVFVAKHLTGGSPCQVCGTGLARRPGKQGYECRDCLLRCHKPCHVKVESLCPSSTVHFMELEFVEDTATGKVPRRL